MRKRTMRSVGLLLAVALLSTTICLAQGPIPANQPDITIDAATRTQVIEALVKELNEKYIFPEVAKQVEKNLRDRLARKEYDNITSAAAFGKMLTDNLREISHDKHLNVNYIYRALPQLPGPGRPPSDQPPAGHPVAKLHFGFT